MRYEAGDRAIKENAVYMCRIGFVEEPQTSDRG